MSKLSIRGAELRSATLEQNAEVVSHCIKFACAPSPALLEHLGWEEFPPYIPGSKLEGEILAKTFILTPDNPGLAKHELQLSCDSIDSFEWSRKQEKGSDSTRVEIRFYVTTSEDGVGALLESYKRGVGATLGVLSFDIKKKPEQMPLIPGAKPEDLKNPKVEPVQEEFVIKDDQGNVVRRFDSLEEMQAAAGEGAGKGVALPTAREGAGGTPHLRGRKPGGLAAKAGAVQ